MTVKVQEVKRVGLPRPPRTRKKKRAALIVNMHPTQLEQIRAYLSRGQAH